MFTAEQGELPDMGKSGGAQQDAKVIEASATPALSLPENGGTNEKAHQDPLVIKDKMPVCTPQYFKTLDSSGAGAP